MIMRCYRFDLHRNIQRFLDGELTEQKSERLFAHVKFCSDCAMRLNSLIAGRDLLADLPRRAPQRDHWEVIDAALDAQTLQPARETRLLWNLVTPRVAVAVLALLVVALSAVLLLRSEPVREIYATRIIGTVDLDEFHPVSISNMESNTRPHVVAEGYVSEVRVSDEEDGDMKFKLVESMEKSSPFIVCEIIQPITIEMPAVGSRVRVYGVSRYDGGEGRNWYEVHPVLNIEAVPR